MTQYDSINDPLDIIIGYKESGVHCVIRGPKIIRNTTCSIRYLTPAIGKWLNFIGAPHGNLRLVRDHYLITEKDYVSMVYADGYWHEVMRNIEGE